MSASSGILPSVVEDAFNKGRAFRIGYEFNLADTSNKRIIVVEISSDMILTKSSLEVDQGSVRYVVRSGDAVLTGTLGNQIPVLRKNNLTGAPQPTPDITLTEVNNGGSLTGGVESPISRVRASSQGNSSASNVSDSNEFRGFRVGTIYLELTELTSSNEDTTGILNLEWIKV